MSETTRRSVERPADLSRRERRKALWGTGLGNAVEWYDWNIYAVFSVVFAASFFPHGDGATGVLQTMAVFAVGFFFRPVGGLVLAALADRVGRRRTMALMVGLMAGGSLLIAVAPTHQQVGVLAPLLLLLARIAQGLSTGGEFAAASAYLAEIAPAGKRGVYSSVFYISTALGTVLAVLTSLVVRSMVNADQLAAWGWRIPFFIGALLGLAAWWIRSRLSESEVFRAVESVPRQSLLGGIRRHPKASLQVFGITVGITTWYYAFAVYLPVSAKGAHPELARQIDVASVGALLLFCVVLPLFGRFSDGFGRRFSMLLFCVAATLTAVPFFAISLDSALSVWLVQSAGLLVFAFYGAIAPTLMSEMFSTEVRATGIGLPYALAVAMFGGTAPYVLEWLIGHDRHDLFGWYLAALALTSLVVSLSLVDRRHLSLHEIGPRA